MSERTICQMEVDPLLIRLRRERSELFRRWREIYDGNPLLNAQQPFYGSGGFPLNVLSALMGNIGAAPAQPGYWKGSQQP